MLSKARQEILKFFDIISEKNVAVCKFCKQKLKNDRVYCLKMHLLKVHDPNSELNKYFETVPDQGMAMCKICKHRVRNSRSYFLRQHLQLMHMISVPDTDDSVTSKKLKSTNFSEKSKNPIIVITGNQSQGVITPSTSSETNNMDAEFKSLQNMANQNEFSYELNKKYLNIEMDKDILMSSVWGLMLEDDITPAIMDSPNMKSLLQPICKALTKEENKEFKLDRIETEKLVCLAANKLRQDFVSNLERRLLTLKIDMDLKASSKTFSLSSLFIQDGKIQTYGLGIIDLKNDSQLTEQHIKHVLHKFNIDSNQIVHISADFSKSQYHKEVKNTEYLKEIHNFEYFPDIQFGQIKIERYAGVIAQLCLLDIFKNSVILNNFLICRNFTKCIRNLSDEYLNLFEENFLTIPELDSPWKWGSTYKMMYNLQQARSILKDLEDHSLNNFINNENMWLFIEAYCELLNFIQKSIIKFYTEEMHYGDLYAQWLKSKLLTSKVISLPSMKNNPFINVISSEMLKSMESRSKEILNKGYFEACLYLDPRFHHTLTKQDKNKAFLYLKKLWNHFKIYNPYVLNAAKNPQDESIQPESFIDEEDAFLNEFLNPGNQNDNADSLEVYNKIEDLKIPFKSVDTNILTFWHNLKSSNPELYELSAICFSIPTTQVIIFIIQNILKFYINISF